MSLNEYILPVTEGTIVFVLDVPITNGNVVEAVLKLDDGGFAITFVELTLLDCWLVTVPPKDDWVAELDTPEDVIVAAVKIGILENVKVGIE